MRILSIIIYICQVLLIARSAPPGEISGDVDGQLGIAQRVGAGVEKVQGNVWNIGKPLNEMLFLVDNRSLAQRPNGDRQVCRPRLANGLEQVLVAAIQMLPEQA
ncbi:hypothetical protein D3C80_1925680 [compost metagenome]